MRLVKMTQGRAARPWCGVGVFLLAITSSAAGADGAAFGFVPHPGVFTTFAGLSADGTVGAGRSGFGSNYDPWVASGLVPSGLTVPSGTVTVLPRVPAGLSSDALGISGDGNVVFGRSGLGTSSLRATRWVRQGNGSWTGAVLNDETGAATGDLPGGSVIGQPRGASFDGSVIVGGSPATHGSEAFRWTAATGMVGLGDLPGGSFFSDAQGVSADGTVIVGTSVSGGFDPATNTNYTASEAFRWTAGTGMVGLGFVPGGLRANGAFGVSGDGSVIVGEGWMPGIPGRPAGRVPTFWTAAAGWVDMGVLPATEASSPESRGGIAKYASHDGSVIVGSAPVVGDSQTFVWTAASGMRSLKHVLLDAGVTDVTDWDLLSVEGISADGRTIVGGAHSSIGSFEAFVLTLPASFVGGGITGDFNGSGQVEQGDLDLILQNWGLDTSASGIPAGWINDNTGIGQVEQTELDKVLQNWGSTSAPDFQGSSVPEPATLAILSLGGLAMLRRRA